MGIMAIFHQLEFSSWSDIFFPSDGQAILANIYGQGGVGVVAINHCLSDLLLIANL